MTQLLSLFSAWARGCSSLWRRLRSVPAKHVSAARKLSGTGQQVVVPAKLCVLVSAEFGSDVHAW